MATTFDAYVSDRGKKWMTACHPQPDVVAEVASDLIHRIRKTRELGPLYGREKDDPIKKLQGFENLWESRVRHATGIYRQFFRFASVNGSRSVVFVDGVVKKSRLLSRQELVTFDRRLDAYLDDLSDPQIRTKDLVR
jgi:hypothetical protein